METTPLFRAPFFNVTGSSVCLGSSSLDKPQNPTFLSLLEYWEKRFWLTEFSHLGGNVNPTVSNLVIVTENIRNNPFDMNELKPMNKNLKTYFHEKDTFYRPLPAQSASSCNGIRHRSRRYRLTSDNQSGTYEHGTSSIGPSRTACHRIRSRHSKPSQYRTPAFQ